MAGSVAFVGTLMESGIKREVYFVQKKLKTIYKKDLNIFMEDVYYLKKIMCECQFLYHNKFTF